MNPSLLNIPVRPVPMKAPAASSPVDATFVLCVESGPLETQTVMAVESLRRWGGRFAECPVLAITPRRGAPLTRQTRSAFDRLGVSWHGFEARHDAGWYGPMNKPAALERADALATTDTVVWMDSDVIVIAEPSELELDDGEGFAALPGSRLHDMASDGDNEHESFWRAMLASQSISECDFPSISGHPGEDREVRMYWQGGVFAYCRSSRLGRAHFDFSNRLIAARLASRVCGAYFTEQLGLALAVHNRGLRHRVLPQSCNLMVNPVVAGRVGAEAIADAKIVHYFGSLWPDAFDGFVALLSVHRPDVAEWVRGHGPLRDRRPVFRRLLGRLERRRRRNEARDYLATCELH